MQRMSPPRARLSGLCSVVALVALFALAGCGRDEKLAPDFAFNFTCHVVHYPAAETAIERFIASHDFTAFNEERVRRQYNLPMYQLAIDGFDAHRRMLDFRGINEKSGDKPEPV